MDETINFFSDIGRILHYLPHISIVDKYSEGKYRVKYSSRELGVYRVNIYCDLAADLQPERNKIYIKPLISNIKAIEPKAGYYYLVSNGNYYSSSQFYPEGDETRIDFELKLEADMPAPLAVKFLPDGVVDSLASSIMHVRIQEIIDGFISRSVRAYNLLYG